MKKNSLIIYILILVGVIILGYIFYNYSHTSDKETIISNNRVIVERVTNQEPFFSHVVTLMASDSLSVEERAQLLADSIPVSEMESIAARWKDAGLSGKDRRMLMSCLSEKGDSDVPSLSADDYEQIFSKWKTIQPENEFLKLLEVK